MDSSPDAGAREDGVPTERTPLLPGLSSSTPSIVRTESRTEELPEVGTFAARLEPEEFPTYDIDKLYPPALQSRAARTAFALCTLLYYRRLQRSGATTRGRDLWAQWREKLSHSEDLDNLVARAWSLFLEVPGTTEEIAEVLWSAFPRRADSAQSIRVMDFIAAGDVPDDFLRHELVNICLLDIWKYGPHDLRGRNGIIATLLSIVDRCGTPRVLYVIDLLTYLVYLGMIYHFPWSPSTIPSLIVLLSFVPRFPLRPIPGDFAFSTVHFAFFYEVILLHLPTQNSPLFLFPPDQVLPLAVLAWRGLSGVVTTAIYFLPGVLFAFIIFALSFSDWGPWFWGQSVVAYPPPFDTRVTLFALFVTMLLFQCCLLVYSVFVQPFLAAYEDAKPTSWDRYTKSVGFQARLVFARQVRLYGTMPYYPAPFNLVQVLFVRLPRLFVVLARRRKSFLEKITVVDRVLWRLPTCPEIILHARAAMSSRRRQGQSTAQPPAKRRKFDHSRPDDDIPTPQSQANAPSAAALSQRVLPPEYIPPLSTICIRVFAENLQKLSRKPTVWEDVRLWLKQLPDPLAQKVFATLKRTCPTLLQHGLIVAYFLRGTSISLSDDLPGVTRLTIFAIGDMSAKDQLRELELTGLAKIADTVFATVVAKLPALRKLNLRGCTKVGQKTVEAAAKHCPLLEVINLNYTAVPPVSMALLLLNCKQLQVMKVAGIPNWTDTAFSKLWDALGVTDGFQLLNLRSLKLRQTALSDAVVNPTLAICPNLERLDLSFTLVKRPILPAGHLLEKLVLTSTKISSSDLLAMLNPLRKLKVLAIGAMGGGQGSSAAISNTSAMTLTDETLHSLTAILEQCTDIERVNLVGNTKLGFTGRRGPDAALARFVRKVGRRCKHLNLANITSLRSSDLEGLAHPDGPDEGPPQLVHLNLNNTSVDDTAAPYISACVRLQTLELASTKFTSAGLFPIIDACERLEKLDLTSCRGVRVSDRRRFFEVWEEEWKNA
ncbi:RNI-like protein [Pilatotrama ljubarskyi]|nr:RNI-like protein [Pilatotrama ljubarskyi]